MNPAIHAALMASTQHQAESIEARLRKEDAISLDKAIAYTASTPAEQKQLDEAIGRGLVMRRANGRIYLNVRAVAERNEGIAHGVLLGLFVAGSVIASVVALVIFAWR